MKANTIQIIGYLAVIIIAISILFIGTKITGFATANDTGIVNVTISQSGAINFTTDILDFGAGAVDGAAGATIDSEGTVTDGTWGATNGQLVLENIGNVNVSLELSANKSASSFIGGTGPTFKAKISNAEANSCSIANFSNYQHINTTLMLACSNFGYDTNVDTINVDFELYIPNNAVGEKTVKITATATY